jgi:competence protein ComGC
MLCVLMIHIVMDLFEITIYIINYLLYVIIIMLIYGIKMIWKMPIILTKYTHVNSQGQKTTVSIRENKIEVPLDDGKLSIMQN